MARLGVGRNFFPELVKLEGPVQQKVFEAFGKFGNASHAGMHLEKLTGVRDSRLRTIRIDRSWRGVVLAPEGDDQFTLLKVLPHDDAYDWARRHQVSVNSAIGTIEVRDVVAIEQALPQLSEHAPSAPTPLFHDVKDAELARLGIDDQVRTLARAFTSTDQLEAARGILPEPQYDVLLGLAVGMTPEEVWAETAGATTEATAYDPDDVTAAVERSPGQVLLVSGPDELMDAFAYPFALWRVYLHPAQHRVAYGSFSGPARVTGGPGTGKTVTALHRVKHLAASASTPKAVLLTTFTKTLAASLDDGLRLLVDDEELLSRVDVRHIDQLAYQTVSHVHGRLPVLSANDERQRWRDALSGVELEITEAFLTAEWRQVILPQGITSVEEYLSAHRTGRGRRLGERQRRQVWEAVTAFTESLDRDRRWTYETICVAATALLAGSQSKPYRHIVVDEAQDLAPWQWRLLRAAVPQGADDLFIAGDTHQRIYNHRVSLRRVGVDIAGRSERLRINYRTSAEILGWSLGILRGERIDDMGDDLATLAGCRSQVHGSPPALHATDGKEAELHQLVTRARGWIDQGVEPDQIGVAARSSALVDDAVRHLRAAGVPAVSLAKRAARSGEIAVATMHRMKGLEYRCVAVIGVSEQQVPPASAITPADEDQVSHELDIQRERCLLFVACTRAREQLAVSWPGRPSPLLPLDGLGR